MRQNTYKKSISSKPIIRVSLEFINQLFEIFFVKEFMKFAAYK